MWQPCHWWLANQRPPRGSGAGMFDCRYEVNTRLQVAAGQSGRDTWRGRWRLMIKFSTRYSGGYEVGSQSEADTWQKRVNMRLLDPRFLEGVRGNCMSTQSTSNELVPPFSDTESVIRNRRRNFGEPSLLVDFEEINMSNNLNHNQGPPPLGPIPQNHNGPPGPNPQNLAPHLQTMEELCQPTMNGQAGPIAPVTIQATDFRLKNHMIQQVQNCFQFHRLPVDDPNKHLDKFLTVTQSMKSK
ncbi:hypothetical protein Tco_0222533 [Tanacetum coccineum]